jgi:4-amino-4-deoxychorismate lyase
MSRLLESIRCENRALQNISYHNQRLNQARKQLFGAEDTWDLAALISIPIELSTKLYKCRVLYAQEIGKIEFQPYQAHPPKTLQLVYGYETDYSFKWENRQTLEELEQQKGSADDILIVRNGLITDTSYCNIVLFDGQQWFTPAPPLLQGTQRACLLAEGKIQEAEIRVIDLPHFKEIRLINAMLRFEEAWRVEIIP